MLSKLATTRTNLQAARKSLSVAKKANPSMLAPIQRMAFGHGPYNPLSYKSHLVPEELPTTEDIYANIKTFHSNPPPPIYNMRHIHPVRQSGPIPAYDGTWTMEDIKKLYGNMRAPWDHTP